MSGRTHIVTMPGITTTKLSASVDNTELRQDIHNVVFHVGTNDLNIQKAANRVLVDNFSKLIDSARRTFPRAKIGITGLLPRKGIPLKTVLTLNKSLESMCNKRNVSLIGDQSMFFASIDSFPRHLFTSDKVHLNEKGVGVLMASVKRHLAPEQDVSRELQRPDHPPPRLTRPPRQQPEAQSGQSHAPRPQSDTDSLISRGGASHQRLSEERRGHGPDLIGAAVPRGRAPPAVNTPFPPPLIMPSNSPFNALSPPFGYANQPMLLFNPANGQYHAMGYPPFVYRH